MKIRSGFVSNSSSSSFLIAVGRVTDLSKFDKLLEKYKGSISGYEYKVIPALALELTLPDKYDSLYTIEDNEAVIESFRDDKVSLDLSKIRNTDGLFALHACGEDDHGDSSFYNEDSGSMDYDVDLSFFSGCDFIKDLKEENGIADVSVEYGAGRNG